MGVCFSHVSVLREISSGIVVSIALLMYFYNRAHYSYLNIIEFWLSDNLELLRTLLSLE